MRSPMDESQDAADIRFMREALAEADRAAALGEVPVGAVAVHGGRVIARGQNLRERSQDPTAHAELIALRAAAHRLGTFRLSDVTMYVTLEPCPMCAGALVNARMGRVVWGCDDPKAGATKTLYQIGNDPRLNHRFKMTQGVLEAECAERLSGFFEALRRKARARSGKP
jgi:tRNA(adenine34) deaminase